jgi:hypothetical protein
MPEWQDFETLNGTRWQYQNENPYIKITTTCEKQEMMLKLKYGDALLLSETTKSFSNEDFYMAPYSRSATR